MTHVVGRGLPEQLLRGGKQRGLDLGQGWARLQHVGPRTCTEKGLKTPFARKVLGKLAACFDLEGHVRREGDVGWLSDVVEEANSGSRARRDAGE